MPSKEAGFVLSDERTGTSAEHGDLLLNLLNVILAGLKVDLNKFSR